MKNTEQLIEEICESMKDLLIEKNRNYGDSATNPSNIFSKQSAVDAICARIDDKLMRISNKGITDETEDTVSDLIGYLVLLKVALIKEEYKFDKNTVEDGGFVSINGRVASTVSGLQHIYDNENCNTTEDEDMEFQMEEEEDVDIETKDSNIV